MNAWNWLKTKAIATGNFIGGTFAGFLNSCTSIVGIENNWFNDTRGGRYGRTFGEYSSILVPAGGAYVGSVRLSKNAFNASRNLSNIGKTKPNASLSGLGKKKLDSPNKIGKLGEDAVHSKFNIGHKEKIKVNGRYRIPDGITQDTLSEVKNVKSLSYTRQLRDFTDIAKSRGLNYDLYVRPSMQLSKPLIQEIKKGAINLKYIPGAK